MHTGKTALVTGGSRGIGAAVVRRLAAAKAHVAINYTNNEAAAQSLAEADVSNGGRAFTVQADVSSLTDIDRMFAACDKVFGGAPNLHILINNAGVGPAGRDGSLQASEGDLYDSSIGGTVRGTYL